MFQQSHFILSHKFFATYMFRQLQSRVRGNGNFSDFLLSTFLMSAIPRSLPILCDGGTSSLCATTGREQMQKSIFVRRTRSIRWDEGIRNFDANLAIVAHRARMKRHEGVLIRVLRKGLACSWTSFHKARLVFENCFDELIYQIVREIGSSDHKIIHSNGNIIDVQRAVRSTHYL